MCYCKAEPLVVYKEMRKIYRRSKLNIDRYLYDHEGYEAYKQGKKFINRVDRTIESIPEPYKFILHFDIQLGREDHWYMEYMSRSTYFRNRKIASVIFMNELD